VGDRAPPEYGRGAWSFEMMTREELEVPQAAQEVLAAKSIRARSPDATMLHATGDERAGDMGYLRPVWPLNSLIPLKEEENRVISLRVFAG
jgi:hypothetical protein